MHGGSGFYGPRFGQTQFPTDRSRSRAVRKRLDYQTHFFGLRWNTPIHQRFSNHIVDPEKSWRRTGRSSRTARSPVAPLAGEAVGRARLVRARRAAARGLPEALPAIAVVSRG